MSAAQGIDPGELPAVPALTCDSRHIDAQSYALTTRAQSQIVNEDRSNSSSTYAASDPSKVSIRPMGIGPLAYQQRVRFTLVKFVDPAGRIKLPKASRSAGW